jgi:hypothetical protein
MTGLWQRSQRNSVSYVVSYDSQPVYLERSVISDDRPIGEKDWTVEIVKQADVDTQ